jgi:ABC-type multidrug transport system permease subunit
MEVAIVRSAVLFTTLMRRQLRNRLDLGLTLLTAPLFVLAYWILFAQETGAYQLWVLDQEAQRGFTSPSPQLAPGRGLVLALREAEESPGRPFFQIRVVTDREALERGIREGAADVGLVIPETFSRALQLGQGGGTHVTLVLDASRQPSRIAGALIRGITETYGHALRQSAPPLRVREQPLGLSGERSGFEMYVPGLVVFTVIMLVFSAAITVARDVETGTLARLRLSPLGTLEMLLGVSAVQLLLGVVAVGLTLLTAFLLGFRSAGSIWSALLISAIAGLASVGIGMVIASLSQGVIRAFLLGSVVMFLLVLFSGVVFPRPQMPLLQVAGRSIGLLDVLPTTHLGVALGKILTLGAGLSEVTYELIWLMAISVLNYLLGVVLFARAARPAKQGWEGTP